MKIQAASVNVTLIVAYLDEHEDPIYVAEPEVRTLKPGQILTYTLPDPIEIEVKSL